MPPLFFSPPLSASPPSVITLCPDGLFLKAGGVFECALRHVQQHVFLETAPCNSYFSSFFPPFLCRQAKVERAVKSHMT